MVAYRSIQDIYSCTICSKFFGDKSTRDTHRRAHNSTLKSTVTPGVLLEFTKTDDDHANCLCREIFSITQLRLHVKECRSCIAAARKLSPKAKKKKSRSMLMLMSGKEIVEYVSGPTGGRRFSYPMRAREAMTIRSSSPEFIPSRSNSPESISSRSSLPEPISAEIIGEVSTEETQIVKYQPTSRFQVLPEVWWETDSESTDGDTEKLANEPATQPFNSASDSRWFDSLKRLVATAFALTRGRAPSKPDEWTALLDIPVAEAANSKGTEFCWFGAQLYLFVLLACESQEHCKNFDIPESLVNAAVALKGFLERNDTFSSSHFLADSAWVLFKEFNIALWMCLYCPKNADDIFNHVIIGFLVHMSQLVVSQVGDTVAKYTSWIAAWAHISVYLVYKAQSVGGYPERELPMIVKLFMFYITESQQTPYGALLQAYKHTQ